MIQAIYYMASGKVKKWGRDDHFLFFLTAFTSGIELAAEVVLLVNMFN